MIDSVKIIHAPDHIKEYRFWADFFRFIGLHVWDCTLKNNDLSEDFSIVMMFKEGISEERVKEIEARYRNLVMFEDNVDNDRYFNVDAQSENEVNEWVDFWNKYLYEGLDKIKEKLDSSNQIIIPSQLNSDYDSIRVMGKFYVKYCLSYYRNVYSYFKEDEELVQKAQDHFVDAYVEISKDNNENQYKKTAYVYYALAGLARCINETCVFLNQELLIPTEQCIIYLDKAIEQNPEFNNAELLKAIICGIDRKFLLDCSRYYENALSVMGNKKYASYPYYLYGRYWERVAKNVIKAKEYYQKSYETNHLEYRAIYKLAILAKQEKSYEESLIWFGKICDILSEKEQTNYLQPKEYEYLFKSYFEISKLYGDVFFDLDRYNTSTEKLDNLCNNMISEEKENRAYEEIFGEQASELRSKTFCRIKEIQIQCRE